MYVCMFMFNVLALLSRHVLDSQKAVLRQILGAQPPAVHSLVMQPTHIRKLLTAQSLFTFVRACQVHTCRQHQAAYPSVSLCLQIWQPQHDKKLLYGVLKHGWEQWLLILKDPLLGVEPILRQELFLLQPQPAAVSNAASAASSRSQLPTVLSGAITLAPDVSTTTAAAAPHAGAVTAVGPAVEAIAGASSKPAIAAGPACSSAPNTAAIRPDGDTAGVPPSQPGQPPAAAASGDGNSQTAHSIKPEPLLPPQPVAPGAPVSGAEDKLKEALHVKVEIQPVSAEGPAAAAPMSTSAMLRPSSSAGKLVHVKLETAATTAAERNSQQSALAGSSQPGEGAGAPLPQTMVTKLPPPIVSGILDLTTAEIPSKSTADAGPAAAATGATTPVLAANAAATSTAKEPRPSDPVAGAAAVTIATSSSASVVLGCPKCRWAPKGCSACRAKWQAAGNPLPAALAVNGSNSANAAAVAAAAAAARVERGTITKLCNWLANRTAVLASILKGVHKVGTPVMAAPSQAQSRVAVTAAPVRLLPRPAGPIIVTQQTSASCPPGGTVALGTPVSTRQWQQSAVQMSHFRQQQRQLQQQQLAAAQEQQRQNLLLQQQQRQRHTSLLRQQHQTAQLQQQQQQAAKAQAAQAQVLQQQQLRLRQQQQQRGLQQQQMNQQHQLQLQLQLHQQQQRQLSSQQQVQRALSSQGSQQAAHLQPQAAAAHVSAAPGAQQPTSSQAQISHPLSM